MSSNKVVCEDCLKYLSKVSSSVFNLVVVDPPFNKGKDYGTDVDDKKMLGDYYGWCKEWVKECFRVLKDDGSFYLYINSQHLGQLQMIMTEYGMWQNTIVWGYTNPIPDRKRFPKSWSGFLFFTKSKKFYFNPDAKFVKGFRTNPKSLVKSTRLSDLWLDVSKLTGGFLAQKEVILKPGTQSRECVYQLPQELLERIILSSTKEEDLVLDLFAHSGTTSAIAKELGRNSVAVEINRSFCSVIERRLFGTIKRMFVEY